MSLTPEKRAEIQAAKSVVQPFLDKLATLDTLRAATELEMVPAVEALIKSRGTNGPFNFGEGSMSRVHFRKARAKAGEPVRYHVSPEDQEEAT